MPVDEAFALQMLEEIKAAGAVDAALMLLRSQLARETNTPEGFGHFYWCVYGRECPDFALKEWIPPLYEAKRAGDGMMLEAWRGSTKSTIMQAFCWFQLGHKPSGSGLMVGASDDAATKMAALAAAVIEYNDGWKACFPHVQPDKMRGWGASGYFVKDARMDYNQFSKETMQDHGRDPSFVGAGITSTDIVGKHPSLFILLDDIHDENNTRSEREMEAVKSSLTANLLPTMSRPGDKPYIAVAFTPWKRTDAYAFLKNTGLLRSVRTPVYRETDGGRAYTWPDAFGEEVVEKWRRALGSIEFARMYLCDLDAAKAGSLRFYSFSRDAIDYDWVMVGGADPTNVIRDATTEAAKGSYFALAFVAKLPQGGAVVVDGILEQCSQIEAENHIAIAQTRYPRYQYTAVENIGGGAVFIQALRRNTALRIVDSDLANFGKKGGRIRSKADRILLEMAPWFENSTVRIATGDSPFLNALRRLFTDFYMLDPKRSPEFDAGDAVYHALKAMPDVLRVDTPKQDLPPIVKARRANPFNELAGRF